MLWEWGSQPGLAILVSFFQPAENGLAPGGRKVAGDRHGIRILRFETKGKQKELPVVTNGLVVSQIQEPTHYRVEVRVLLEDRLYAAPPGGRLVRMKIIEEQ